MSLTVGLVAAGAGILAAAAGVQALGERRFQKLKEQYPGIYEKLLNEFRFGSHFRYDNPDDDAREFLPKAVAIVKKGKDFEVEISGGTWHWEEQPPQYTGTYEGAYPQQVEVKDNEPLVIELIEKDKAMSVPTPKQTPDAVMLEMPPLVSMESVKESKDMKPDAAMLDQIVQLAKEHIILTTIGGLLVTSGLINLIILWRNISLEKKIKNIARKIRNEQNKGTLHNLILEIISLKEKSLPPIAKGLALDKEEYKKQFVI